MINVKASLEAVLGAGKVSASEADLIETSHDSWPLSSKLRMINSHDYKADIVVYASDEEDICNVLNIASDTKTPVTVRALASSVTGQPLPTKGGIVLDVANLEKSYSINKSNMTVEVSAGYNGGELEDILQNLGYTTGHSPQSLYRSSVGGWLSTLATGQFSSYYGGIEHLITSYEVILISGQKVKLKANPRAAMGPDLRQVFIGAEGTLGVVTSVTMKIFELPEKRIYQTALFPTVEDGLNAMREITHKGLAPFLLRFYDNDEAKHAMGDLYQGSPAMFLGSQGLEAIAEVEMKEVLNICEKHGATQYNPEPVNRWLEKRFDFSKVENLLAQTGGYAETIEIAHNWDQISGLYDDLRSALLDMSDHVLSHFSHVYPQGTSMYIIVLGNKENDVQAVELLESIWKKVMGICLEHGAELSHHHGGGLARSKYAKESIGSGHVVLQKLKTALDPDNLLNPGKLGLE
ncbi:FAD-binding oxidoreductase [Vibrio mediterranei]|uniref:FAD-binding oxidoreductase n=1 Tax=Vibrio mediterranei TaxID=689 RepID=UPI00148DDD50|nr:FAD-binding oxidoreductase [Vibrio mediterranei]NOI23806.1 FAD-binding oxidoreductase [Vibrio mediterranei]